MFRRLLRHGRDTIVNWQRLNNNRAALTRLRKRGERRLHLGCGDNRLPDFANVDCRLTAATDYVVDLNELRDVAPGSATLIYSNAFFEHLYRDQRVRHLQSVVRALDAAGACCYIGLPDFRAVATLYLADAPGLVGPRFDLYHVYRYTHGDPESVGSWWLEQLHKSLFDDAELTGLLTQAGFGSYVLFNYCYPGEPKHPVNLGFYATAALTDRALLERTVLAFLSKTCPDKVLVDTVCFIGPGRETGA